ncbi:hypothetical protein [Kribbella solani]|uniref:Uncharacterized protein n=1 Tax=Kribbella solani TaxID=236067 RepID=A0A841DMY2_9ACTN|nr:hypothetical protein [Kribbella solani]MBB5977777.1 hypothetical protein [Kribbella solani]MDX2970607.1 hypothetical protein [Kribbella solani]MDX3006145.1 hypothetical protein [Kribbella solani]
MFGRFTVRPSDDGTSRFGVWDGAVNGWRATGIDDEGKARELASDLDVQYDAHGPRAADAVRHVDPALPVQRASWSAGVLDVWVREHGQWIGRFRDENGNVTWVPGAELRQL